VELNVLPKKSRAWDDKLQKMCYFDLTTGGHNYVAMGLPITQEVGTIDVNGSNMFEGDIILWNKRHWIISWNARNTQHFFESTNSFLKDSKKVWGEWGWLSGRLKFTEVVGNVYENPELIVGQDYSYNRFDVEENDARSNGGV